MAKIFVTLSLFMTASLLSGCVALGIAAAGGAAIGYGATRMSQKQNKIDEGNTSQPQMSTYHGHTQD